MIKSILEIEQHIDSLISSRQELFDLKKPIDIKISEISDEIKKQKELLTIEKLKTQMTIKEKFEFLMFEDGLSYDMIRTKEAQNFINNDLGLWLSGYSPFSEQKKFRIKLHKGSNCNLLQHFNSLNLILPFIKPDDDKLNKNISIFEHSLSLNEKMRLQITPDNVFNIIGNIGNRDKIKIQFNDLFSALTYIQKYYYYSSDIEKEDLTILI